MGSDETAMATTGGPRVIDVFDGNGCHRDQIIYCFRMQIAPGLAPGQVWGRVVAETACAGSWCSPESSGSKTLGTCTGGPRTAIAKYDASRRAPFVAMLERVGAFPIPNEMIAVVCAFWLRAGEYYGDVEDEDDAWAANLEEELFS